MIKESTGTAAVRAARSSRRLILGTATLLVMTGCYRTDLRLGAARPGPGDARSEDLGDGNGPDSDGPDSDDSVALPSLSLTAATAHSLSVHWEPTIVPTDATGFALTYEQRDLASVGGSPTRGRWDQLSDPTLAFVSSPVDGAPVQRTTVAGLQAAAQYLLALLARDTNGVERVIARGEAATLTEPMHEAVIFMDGPIAAPAWLVDFDLAPGLAYSGNEALVFHGNDSWVNGILGGINVELTGMDNAAQSTAYLEFFVRLERPFPVYYLSAGLSGEDGCRFGQPAEQYTTLRPTDTWQEVEVAFSQLHCDGRTLADVGLGPAVQWFRLGFVAPAGTAVYVDEVRVRF